MQTQLTLEERYCDAIFNQGSDFSKILALMLGGKDLALLETAMSLDLVDERAVNGDRLDVFTILSIYQKAIFAGIKNTHSDTMLLHFLANQPPTELPKIKQFTSMSCGARFFTPVLDLTFFHLDLSLLEPDYIFPAIHAFFVYMHQKPHAGINLNIVINEPTEFKIAELKRICHFVFPFLVNREVDEHSDEHNYSITFSIRGNLIPSLGSAFKPVNLIHSIETQQRETIAAVDVLPAAEPPSKKSRLENDKFELTPEQITESCFAM